MSDIRPPVAVEACGVCDVTHPTGWGYTEDAGRHRHVVPTDDQRNRRRVILTLPLKQVPFHKRCAEAVELITQAGGVDGGHHKQWVLDQVLRILLGSDAAYASWVALYEDADGVDLTPEEEQYKADGEKLYEWDEGIAP